MKDKDIAFFFYDDGTLAGSEKIRLGNTNHFLAQTGKQKNKRLYILDKSKVNPIIVNSVNLPLIRLLFPRKRIYVYNINRALPFNFRKQKEPEINLDTFQEILDNKVLSDLSRRSNSFIESIISNWKTILVFIVIGFALYYFMSGGSLT